MISISKDTWSPIAKKVGKFVITNAPRIAGYTGIAGFLVAIGLTYKNAADIHEGINERDTKKVIKKTLPIAAAATASAVAIHYGMQESDRRLAAAMAAYSLSDAAYNELKNSIDKSLSPKKVSEVEHKLKEDKVNEAVSKVEDINLIETTGNGNLLCCELLTGKLFYSDKAYVDRVINEINEMFDNGEDMVSLSDIHWRLGLRQGDFDSRICWHRDYSRVKITWDSMLLEDGTPVATIEFRRYGIIGPDLSFLHLN